MASQAWLIADRPQAVIQPGQPPAQQAAWLLDVPDGESGLQVAADFANDAGFPVGTVARVIDLAVTPLAIQTFKLISTWEAI